MNRDQRKPLKPLKEGGRMMLGALPGGVLDRMLRRCLSDAIFRLRVKFKKIPLLLDFKATRAFVMDGAKRGVF